MLAYFLFTLIVLFIFTADNESDSGYAPSLMTSKQYGSLQSLDRLHQQVEGGITKKLDSDTEGRSNIKVHLTPRQ